MKKYLPLMIIGIVAVAAITALVAFRNTGTEEGNKKSVSAGDKIEVFYFHLTRRCVTCQAVENVSRDAVSEIYADEIKRGKVIFRALNIEDKASEPEAERAQATGQCLLVISGETRIDLTSEGFMYAKTDPDRLKAELKKAIDPLLTEIK